jgi:gas vesicle protein
MRYSKLISKYLTKRNNNAQVVVAVVAGLAAGAILSILFAPESGSDTRSAIGNKAKGIGGGLKNSFTSLKDRLMGNVSEETAQPAPEVPHFKHTPTKRRKSDIKDLVSEAHQQGDQHTEQAI